MRSWQLFASLVLGPILSLSSFGQATAEAVITRGAASVAGTAGGTILGPAANRMGERIGRQTSSAIAHPAVVPSRARPVGQRKLQGGVRPALPGNGFLVVSIEGEHEESRCPQVSSQGDHAKPTTSTWREVSPGTSYPSVVNLDGRK
jgi:hypothetical protein